MRLHWSHLAAFALGVVGCILIAYHGPILAEYSPQLASLARRYHTETLRRVEADSGRALYARRLAFRDSALTRLEQRESAALVTSHRYATQNGRLLDSLARLNPALLPALTRIAQGVANQDSACSEAANTCAMVKDSLRQRTRESDSITTRYVNLTGRFATLSHDAIQADSLAERETARRGRTLTLTRIGAAVLVILALVVR